MMISMDWKKMPKNIWDLQSYTNFLDLLQFVNLLCINSSMLKIRWKLWLYLLNVQIPKEKCTTWKQFFILRCKIFTGNFDFSDCDWYFILFLPILLRNIAEIVTLPQWEAFVKEKSSLFFEIFREWIYNNHSKIAKFYNQTSQSQDETREQKSAELENHDIQ